MFSDWHLAMASYNGGPGRVQRAVKASGLTDFWELTANDRYLPRETREYVPMILAAMIIAKNPAQYGFDVPPVESLDYDKVEVAGRPSTFAAWRNGPARPSTKSRRSTPNSVAGPRRSALPSTRSRCRPARGRSCRPDSPRLVRANSRP